MSVFRAAASGPSPRPPAETAPAGVPVQQRRPAPAPRTPPAHLPDAAYADGPTEPLAGAREAAERQAAVRQAAAREAAVRAAVQEAAARDATRLETVLRDAVPQDPGVGVAEPRRTRAQAGETRANAGSGHGVRDAEARPTASNKIGSTHGGAPLNAAEDRWAGAAGDGSRRRPGVVLAVLLSLFALLISGATGLLSWQSLRATTAAMARVAQPSASMVPGQAREPRPESYPVAYAKEPLRLSLDCAAAMFLDLDEPRADAAEALGDLRYESRCGSRPAQLSLGAGAAGGSRQAGADTDAAGCDRAIRTGPLGRGLPVEVKPGAALCVRTAAVPAGLVLVEIIDVGGSGTAGLRATSWRVP